MAVIGLKYLAVAPLATETDGSEPTYTAGMKVGHLMKADLSWNSSDAKLHGDNVTVERDNSKVDGSLTVGTTYLSIAGRQMMLGETSVTSGSDTIYITTDECSPYLGVGFVTTDSADGGAKVYVAYWYYKVQFTMNESYETRGDSVNFQTPELAGSIIAVRPDSTLKNRFRKYAQFATEAEAIAWVKTQAGITA